MYTRAFSADYSTRHKFSRSHIYTQKLTTAVGLYIGKGTTFRVPTSYLQRPKRNGDMDLIDVAATCRALLLSRLYMQGQIA